MNSASIPTSAAPTGRRRRLRLFVLAAALVLSLLAYGLYWFFDARYYQSTDDAYVDGDTIQVTSDVTGTVLALHVDDTQTVQRGQVLLELDPADAEVAMSNAEANLGRAVRQVRALFAQSNQLRAQIEERTVELKRANDDLSRRSRLVNDGAVSREELSHNQDNVHQIEASLSAAREQLIATLAQIDGTSVATNPQVLSAAAAVRDAALALRRTKIVAPVSGVVVGRSVQLGQRVSPGAPLLAVVPLDQVWVDANFKEVQLERMRIGQPVRLNADLYGRHADYHGTLVGLAAGSGNAFALLPSQNASGNWIKIVQRVPVRIVLDPHELEQYPLRVGLSMSVRVDLHNASGSLVATQVRSRPLPAAASLGDDPAVGARIAKIVEDNSRAPLSAAARRPQASQAAHRDTASLAGPHS